MPRLIDCDKTLFPMPMPMLIDCDRSLLPMPRLIDCDRSLLSMPMLTDYDRIPQNVNQPHSNHTQDVKSSPPVSKACQRVC